MKNEEKKVEVPVSERTEFLKAVDAAIESLNTMLSEKNPSKGFILLALDKGQADDENCQMVICLNGRTDLLNNLCFGALEEEGGLRPHIMCAMLEQLHR